MNDILNQIDILSFQPEIKINGNSRFITLLGKLISLICIITIIIISFSIILEVLTRENYTIIYNMDNRERPIVKLNESQLGFVLTDAVGQEIKEYDRYFNFLAKFWKFELINNDQQNTSPGMDTIFTKYNITDLPLRKCSNLNFTQFTSFYNGISRGFPSGVCIDFSNFNETLYGKYGDVGGYSTLNIYIRKCMNSTALNKTNCYPEDQIDKKLSQLFLSIISIEYDIDSNNFENPVLPYTKSEMLSLSSTIFKNFFKDMNIVRFISNNGFIFDKIQSYETLRTDKIVESADLRGKNTLFPGTFSQITFRCTGKTEIYYRSYLRFQAAFAYIGGVLQALILLGKCFVYFFSKNSMMNYLFMHLFNYEEIKAILNEDINIDMKKFLNNMDDFLKHSVNKSNSREKQRKTNIQESNLKSINFNSNSNIIGNENNFKLKINNNKIRGKNDLNLNLQNMNVSDVNKKIFFDRKSLNENLDNGKINFTNIKKNTNRYKRNMSDGISDLKIGNKNEFEIQNNKNHVYNNLNINAFNQIQFNNNNSDFSNLKFVNQIKEKSYLIKF